MIYPALGLVNEAGEVAGKIKKVFRDKGGEINAETREALKAELGDVLWYLAQVAASCRPDPVSSPAVRCSPGVGEGA